MNLWPGPSACCGTQRHRPQGSGGGSEVVALPPHLWGRNCSLGNTNVAFRQHFRNLLWRASFCWFNAHRRDAGSGIFQRLEPPGGRVCVGGSTGPPLGGHPLNGWGRRSQKKLLLLALLEGLQKKCPKMAFSDDFQNIDKTDDKNIKFPAQSAGEGKCFGSAPGPPSAWKKGVGPQKKTSLTAFFGICQQISA